MHPHALLLSFPNTCPERASGLPAVLFQETESEVGMLSWHCWACVAPSLFVWIACFVAKRALLSSKHRLLLHAVEKQDLNIVTSCKNPSNHTRKMEHSPFAVAHHVLLITRLHPRNKHDKMGNDQVGSASPSVGF